MLCENCGKTVKQTDVFCGNCGTKVTRKEPVEMPPVPEAKPVPEAEPESVPDVIASNVEVLEKSEMMLPNGTFLLYGEKIAVQDEIFQYNDIRWKFINFAIEKSVKYKAAYDLWGNIEAVNRNAIAFLKPMLDEAAGLALQCLVEYKVFDYTKTTFLERCKPCLTTFERWQEYSVKENKEINFGVECEREDRQFDKKTRTKYEANYTPYFGNQILRNIAAGAINAATGVAYSAVNGIGNAATEIEAMDKKKKLYQEGKDAIEEMVAELFFEMHQVVCDILQLPVPTTTKAEDARIENLALMPPQEGLKTALALLTRLPYIQEIYTYLLQTRKDPNGALGRFAGLFNLSLEKDKTKLLLEFARTLPADTLENIRATKIRYAEELEAYAMPADQTSENIICVEQKLFEEACTFQKTIYSSLAEKEKAEAQYELDKTNIADKTQEIDAACFALNLKYDEQSYEKAKEVHDSLEKRYAGLARTQGVLRLKQFLHLYEKYKQQIKEAQEQPLLLHKQLGIWGGLIAVAILLQYNLDITNVFWIVCLGVLPGIFGIYFADCFIKDQFKKDAQQMFENDVDFIMNENMTYSGTENYSLEHKNNELPFLEEYEWYLLCAGFLIPFVLLFLAHIALV